MEAGSATILPAVLTAMSAVAAILLGVWAIIARYDHRMRMELGNRIDKQGDRSEQQAKDLHQRIEDQGKEASEQLGQLRERMAKLEGLLEGLREAVTGKRAA